MNGNTKLMSDLTDNYFYPTDERIWLCICLNNSGKWKCDRLAEDAEAQFDLGGYVNKQNYRIWGTENPHEKPTHSKRVTVWCGF